MGTLSEYNYVATGDKYNTNAFTQCMTLSAKDFNDICDQFPVTRAFILVRGVQRRAHFRRIHSNLKAQVKKNVKLD